jgi:DNA-directed RNA polymerase
VETVAYKDQTKNVDPRRQRNGLAPNVIHSLDASILMDVVNRSNLEGCISLRAVHDSYGALPKHMDMLSRAVRESYAETFAGNWLKELRAQWQSQMPEGIELPALPKQGTMKVKDVLKSDYFFA